VTITGRARRDGVSVEVAPGGALISLRLDAAAPRLGVRLAGTILALVREASADANRRVKSAMRAEFGGLTVRELAALGIVVDGDATENGRRG
jgi:hypothetical protein